jgi:hypothetical protein
MGSGETAPTMVKVHRHLLDRLGPDASAVLLDTPYGFQENAPELAERARRYFRESVGRTLEVAGLPRLDVMEPVELERALARVRTGGYLFAGPGSPTYSLRQWRGSALPDLLVDKLRTGGAVTFASAAALTLGPFTVPVYEIYKAGEDPYWLDGLDVLGAVGIPAVVIPHFDNAEGGHHDTRFCYLGERRLRIMESLLPDGVHVIGVDEHTGVVIDLDADTATVVGNGSLTVRMREESAVYPSGTTLPVDALRAPARSRHEAPARTAAPEEAAATPVPEPGGGPTSLLAEAEACATAFDAALAARDADGAVAAVLALEEALHRWSADTLTSDEGDRARALLRSMVVRLGDVAVGGLADPAQTVGPYVEALLAVRATARAEKRYDLSDLVRDRLDDLGVEVRDTPDGVAWQLRS